MLRKSRYTSWIPAQRNCLRCTQVLSSNQSSSVWGFEFWLSLGDKFLIRLYLQPVHWFLLLLPLSSIDRSATALVAATLALALAAAMALTAVLAAAALALAAATLARAALALALSLAPAALALAALALAPDALAACAISAAATLAPATLDLALTALAALAALASSAITSTAAALSSNGASGRTTGSAAPTSPAATAGAAAAVPVAATTQSNPTIASSAKATSASAITTTIALTAPVAAAALALAPAALAAGDERRRIIPSARRRYLLVHPECADRDEERDRDPGERRPIGHRVDHIVGQRRCRGENPDDPSDGSLGAVDDGQRNEQPEQRNLHARERHRHLDPRARGRDAAHHREHPSARSTITIVISTNANHVDRCIGSRDERLNWHHHQRHRRRDHRSYPRLGLCAPSLLFQR